MKYQITIEFAEGVKQADILDCANDISRITKGVGQIAGVYLSEITDVSNDM